MAQTKDPWGVASVTPIAGTSDPWGSPNDPNHPAGLPAGVDLPQLPAHPPVNMQPSILGRDPNPGPVANFVKGAVKSIPGTMAGIAKLYPGAGDAVDPLEQAAKTNGTAQAAGKVAGNIAQFLIPGAAEERLGLYGASKLPVLGEYAAPIAKMGASALTTGAVNKAQGGSFGAGAVMGGAGRGATQALSAWAPKVAESAIKVLGNDRLYGRTIGQAVLDDTKGYSPKAIASSAQAKIDELTPELENIADKYSQAGARGSLAPARQGVQDTINYHLDNRAMNTANDIKPLQSFLNKDARTGLPLAESQTPTGLLRAKRGIDADLIGNWNPNKNTQQALGAARKAYGNVADEFHAAAPGTEAIDQRVSSLIPVADRANRVALSAPTTQQMFNKIAAPTGALAAPIAGGVYGYQKDGLAGMLSGAATGMMLPAMLSTPSGQMMLARSLYSSALPKVAAPLFSGAMLKAGQGLYGNKNPSGQ